MRIAVVDDEAVWRKKIFDYLSKIIKEGDTLELFTSGEMFLEKSERYDIVFLDIEMKGIGGFETTKRYHNIYPGARVAFLTTHRELSDEGYTVSAFRFIDKLKMEEKIKEALRALQEVLRNNKLIEINISMKGKYSVAINNIIYVETHKHNTIVHLRSGIHECIDSMQDMCGKLEKEGFFKCHQSFLVNLDDVESYSKEDVFLKNGEKIMLSKRQRKDFEDAYFKRIFKCANK